MTPVINFGGTSMCRTEALIQSELPYDFESVIDFCGGDQQCRPALRAGSDSISACLTACYI